MFGDDPKTPIPDTTPAPADDAPPAKLKDDDTKETYRFHGLGANLTLSQEDYGQLSFAHVRACLIDPKSWPCLRCGFLESWHHNSRATSRSWRRCGLCPIGRHRDPAALHWVLRLVMGLQGRPWNDCQGQEKAELRRRFDQIKATTTQTPPTDGSLPPSLEDALNRIGVL